MERSAIRDFAAIPAYRCAHAGYLLQISNLAEAYGIALSADLKRIAPTL
jgi:hypothetical protein